MSVIVVGSAVPPELGMEACSVVPDAATTRFDSAAEAWTVTTDDGQSVAARVVVDVRPSADPVVAGHGIPNYFRVPGPDVRRQARYVARCLRLIERSGATRGRGPGPDRAAPLARCRWPRGSTSPVRNRNPTTFTTDRPR